MSSLPTLKSDSECYTKATPGLYGSDEDSDVEQDIGIGQVEEQDAGVKQVQEQDSRVVQGQDMQYSHWSKVTLDTIK